MYVTRPLLLLFSKKESLGAAPRLGAAASMSVHYGPPFALNYIIVTVILRVVALVV